ncbi:hypothetical protein QYF36_008442 [Acer negundo]|nr:hypothetical protein QYF36_008442 [Acer negundo]
MVTGDKLCLGCKEPYEVHYEAVVAHDDLQEEDHVVGNPKLEKLCCYVSDEGGSLLVFKAVAEAANFASVWVPFCRKHYVEPRNPETYFNQKRDLYKNKVHPDFVRERRRVKREKLLGWLMDHIGPVPGMFLHRDTRKVMLRPACDDEPIKGGDSNSIDLTDVEINLPMLVYISLVIAFAMSSALYGFDPPRLKERTGFCSCFFGHLKNTATKVAPEEDQLLHIPKKFGKSSTLVDSIQLAAFQGRPLAYHPSVKTGRPAGALITPRELLDGSTIAEAISVISCSYEDKTEWGQRIGWIYGSITEDIITGYRMHNRGWKSVYHVTKIDAFRGTACPDQSH